MARKTAPAPTAESLTARIGTIEHTYFIAADGDSGPRTQDEAILNIVGVIECIGSRYQRFLGQPLEMAFICARSFERKELTPTANKPLLLPIELRKDRRSLMAYLPSDAFWALSSMISARLLTHIEARFSGLRYGIGDLLSIHFTQRREKG